MHVGGAYSSDGIYDPYGLLTFPEDGEVYTIREVRVRFVSEFMTVRVGLLLEEIENPITSEGSGAGEDMAFDARMFRPLQHAKAEHREEAHAS